MPARIAISKAERRRLCRPKQILFASSPGAYIRCPNGNQLYEGIRFPYGRSLLLLPRHYPLRDGSGFSGDSRTVVAP